MRSFIITVDLLFADGLVYDIVKQTITVEKASSYISAVASVTIII